MVMVNIGEATKNRKVGNLPEDYGEQMAKRSIDELFNTITIEEATDDYYKAYKYYMKDEEVYTVQIETILGLPEDAEVTILQNTGIMITGLKSINNHMLNTIEEVCEEYYIHNTSKGTITIIAYFIEDYKI